MTLLSATALFAFGCTPQQDAETAPKSVDLTPIQTPAIYNDYLNRDIRDDMFYFVLPDRFNKGNPDNDNGSKTYVAHNYSNTQITVNYSDGYQLIVPANKMVTSRDINVSTILSSDKKEISENESINLSVNTTGNGITKIEFYIYNVL